MNVGHSDSLRQALRALEHRADQRLVGHLINIVERIAA
jgi:hypothetical protein